MKISKERRKAYENQFLKGKFISSLGYTVSEVRLYFSTEQRMRFSVHTSAIVAVFHGFF